MLISLTPKQERFAQQVVALDNQSEAYRRVYDVSPTTSDAVTVVKASELAHNGKVAVRIRELQDEAAMKRSTLASRSTITAPAFPA